MASTRRGARGGRGGNTHTKNCLMALWEPQLRKALKNLQEMEAIEENYSGYLSGFTPDGMIWLAQYEDNKVIGSVGIPVNGAEQIATLLVSKARDFESFAAGDEDEEFVDDLEDEEGEDE